MYYDHYGLNAAPFKITPDTQQFYHGAERGDILSAIKYAILSGEGIIKVVGEVGSGKTMLCRMLEVSLPKSVEIVYLANPSLSAEDTLHAIAFEMKLSVPKDVNRLKVMQVLQQVLLERHANNQQVVIFIEEAQRMSIDTLEEIRLLSNLETGQNKLLQMVLFGQPELENNLAAKNIRQLKERITQSFYLSPFTVTDVSDYLEFRLRNAGYRGPNVFAPEVIKIFARTSKGLARRINILADKALLAAYAENTHTVTRKHARRAIADSEFSRLKTTMDIKHWLIAASLGAIVLLLGQFSVPYISSALSSNDANNVASIATPHTRDMTQNSPAPANEAAVQKKPGNESSIQATTAMSSKKTAVKIDTVSALKPEPVTPNRQAAALPIVTKLIKTPKNNSSSPEKPQPKKPPPSVLVANSPSNDPPLTKQRTQATTVWLEKAKAGSYSIQIMMLGENEAQRSLEKFLQRKDMRSRLPQVFIYNTVIRGKPMTGVAFGEYKNYKLAIEALNGLPTFLKKLGPHLRTIKGLRQDMET